MAWAAPERHQDLIRHLRRWKCATNIPGDSPDDLGMYVKSGGVPCGPMWALQKSPKHGNYYVPRRLAPLVFQLLWLAPDVYNFGIDNYATVDQFHAVIDLSIAEVWEMALL